MDPTEASVGEDGKILLEKARYCPTVFPLEIHNHHPALDTILRLDSR